MSVETGFLDIGFLVSDNDMRNSTITGTTQGGPNGSGQFLFVKPSTANTFAVSISTSSTVPFMGVMQNKPSTGIGADVKVFGISKVVLGSTVTLPVVGTRIMISSNAGNTSLAGTVSAFSSTAGFAVGVCLENPTTLNQVFSALLYGPAGQGSSWLQGA
jgi:hypothetical protein